MAEPKRIELQEAISAPKILSSKDRVTSSHSRTVWGIVLALIENQGFIWLGAGQVTYDQSTHGEGLCSPPPPI